MLRSFRSAIAAQHVFSSSKLITRGASGSSSSSAVQLSIRETFADIRNSLSLLNQNEQLKSAEHKVSELSKELEVIVLNH